MWKQNFILITWAADWGVNDFVVVSASADTVAAVVDEGEADAKNGYVDFLELGKNEKVHTFW